MLKIDDNFRIEKRDKLNLVLIEKKEIVKKKTGEKVIEDIKIGYFNNLGSALKSYVNICISREIEVDVNIDYLIQKITELKIYITEAVTSQEER